MLAQHKNHLAVHGGGESTVEEMIGKGLFSFEFTLMRESDYKIDHFLVFEFDLRFSRILKLLHIHIFWSIIYLIFEPYFISSQCSVFIPE